VPERGASGTGGPTGHRPRADLPAADPGAHAGSDRVDRADRVARVDRADRVAQRLAVPVLIAALASVPAVFLTLLDEPYGTIGAGLNTLSGAVLIAETVVLFAVAENRLAWLRRNRWLVLLTVAIVPAVVFAVGPVQLLRLTRVAHAVRMVGAVRIIRAGRIVKAGRILRERAGLDARWQGVVAIIATLLAAAFVTITLADPTSTSGGALRGAVDVVGVPGVVLAGLILGGATYIVRTNRLPVRPGRRPAGDPAAPATDGQPGDASG
jgi:CsoR family transcriptional regulator, copper-sensing transcriptional repressor